MKKFMFIFIYSIYYMCVCDFDVHFGEHLVTHWVFIKISGEIFNFTIYVNTFVNFQHSHQS